MVKRASGKTSRKAATKRKSVVSKKVSDKKRPAKKTAVSRATSPKKRAAATKKTAKKTIKKSSAPKKTAAKKTAAKRKPAAKRPSSPAKAASKPSGVRSKSTTAKAATSDRLSKQTMDRKSSHTPASTRKPQQASRARSKLMPRSDAPRETPVTQPAPQKADNQPGMMGDGTQEQNLNQAGNPEARITQDDVDAAFGERDKKES